MKKFLVLSLFVFAVNFCFAQSVFTGGISLGGVASQMSGDGLAGWDKLGVYAGGWVHAELSKKIGAQMNIQFMTKGSRKNADQDNGDFNTFAFNLTYIEVPVLATYTLNSWRFGVGPSFGVLLSQEQVSNGFEFEINPPFRSFDLSGCGSIQASFGDHLGMELRAYTSIIPIRPAPQVVNPLSFYEQGNYNQVLSLGVVYTF